MHDIWSPRPGLREGARLGPDSSRATLRRLLLAANRDLAAAGSAVFWPRLDGVARWWAEYEGEEPEKVRRWIGSRLDSPLEEIAASLAGESPRLAGVAPETVTVGSGAAIGLWVLWSGETASGGEPETLERFRRALDCFVEVEHGEQFYFRGDEAPLGEEATRALRRGDEEALPELLALTREMSGADFAYLGSVHDGVVDVEWHLGAGDSGFGFELPVGEGVGGRVFARERVIEIPDYLNCRYRYPEVSAITDSEDVRSVLAVPVRSAAPRTGAVLYAVRREISPFSAAQKALLGRLTGGIEPVPGPWPVSRRLSSPRRDGSPAAKASLRRLLSGSDRVQEIESWLERNTSGAAILTDRQDRPHILRNAGRLERLRASPEAVEPRMVSLPDSGSGDRLHLWGSLELQREWPDFIEDVAAACGVVVDRAEQGYRRLNRRRSRWVRDVMEARSGPELAREGNRLGLPVEGGEVWAIAWELLDEPGQTRREMLAEDIGLDELGSPLVTLGGNTGVFLLKGEPRTGASAVRDELLKCFGPARLWLVHGAAYHSLAGLDTALTQSVGVVERARREGEERYVCEVSGRGLDSLLEHPRVSAEIQAFSDNLLAPLTDYDRDHGSRLTETFCLAQTLGSTAERRPAGCSCTRTPSATGSGAPVRSSAARPTRPATA